MTDEQQQMSRAYEAFMDAIKEASLHDQHETPEAVRDHVADILAQDGFTVVVDSITIDPEFQHASAKFVMKGVCTQVKF